jgi:hypothetical protein
MNNPFLIDVKERDDWSSIQSKLREKEPELDALIASLYTECPSDFGIPFDEIQRRVKRGIKQALEPATQEMFQIGDGGPHCFVCSTPALGSDSRGALSLDIPASLEAVGFHGHFLLFQGGFPNPTGKERAFAGVPYCFKIFMMMEAQKRGFDKVIWIDAACLAVNNPTRLFDLLETDVAVFRSFPANMFQRYNQYIFPAVLQGLNDVLGSDVKNDTCVNSIVFGLRMSAPEVVAFIEEYYRMVERGWPFLSHFPEEVVFAVLFNQDPESFFPNRPEHPMLYINEGYLPSEEARKHGYYFIQRGH